MKQLLIVKTSTSLNGKTGGGTISNARDLSQLAEGAITFFKVSDNTLLSDKATENFGIALGGGSNKPAFVIPEVDIDTLTVTKSDYAAGVNYSGAVTIPSPNVTNSAKTYTLILVKLGTGINGERNKWSKTVYVPKGASKTDVQLAADFRAAFKDLQDSGSVNIAVTPASTATVTITGTDNREKWKLVAADDLQGATIVETQSKPGSGDKAYVEKLARECAGNKGFTNTDLESQHIYPGYPETVENVNYNIYTLRFATKRDAGKQTDERIWQYVHIAIPSSITPTVINKILVSSVLPNAAVVQSGT